jgi:cell division protein FtsZ
MDNDTNLPSESPNQNPDHTVRVKVFGVGDAGTSVVQLLMDTGFPAEAAVVVNTNLQPLQTCSAAVKIPLETKLLRGLGSGGDPERGRALAEEQSGRLKSLCEGIDLVFVVAGLGGGCGSGAAPTIAHVAKEAGALVLGFALTPFGCEGGRRRHIAHKGLEAFKEAADGVLCLPNEKIFKLIDETTSVLETFKLSNEMLADAVKSIWRLATHKGLIDIHFVQLCELLRDQHTESSFAVAEAIGATRSRDVLDKALGHPLLDAGALLPEADAVLVSVMGGPDLTMAEVNRIMQEINSRCEGTQVIMGATIHPDFRDRLALTLIAVRNRDEASERSNKAEPEELQNQLLSRSASRTNSRFLPPAPTLDPEQMQQLIARQDRWRGRRRLPRMRQTQLPLEIISKGRFDKSEPTIHKGEDLDVPTYIRRGVVLN